jgi:hypothetical protein
LFSSDISIKFDAPVDNIISLPKFAKNSIKVWWVISPEAILMVLSKFDKICFTFSLGISKPIIWLQRFTSNSTILFSIFSQACDPKAENLSKHRQK